MPRYSNRNRSKSRKQRNIDRQRYVAGWRWKKRDSSYYNPKGMGIYKKHGSLTIFRIKAILYFLIWTVIILILYLLFPKNF